jgi:hypothetical protein
VVVGVGHKQLKEKRKLCATASLFSAGLAGLAAAWERGKSQETTGSSEPDFRWHFLP